MGSWWWCRLSQKWKLSVTTNKDVMWQGQVDDDEQFHRKESSKLNHVSHYLPLKSHLHLPTYVLFSSLYDYYSSDWCIDFSVWWASFIRSCVCTMYKTCIVSTFTWLSSSSLNNFHLIRLLISSKWEQNSYFGFSFSPNEMDCLCMPASYPYTIEHVLLLFSLQFITHHHHHHFLSVYYKICIIFINYIHNIKRNQWCIISMQSSPLVRDAAIDAHMCVHI